MALRQHYCELLDEIRSDVVRMGGRANEMVRLAVEATLNGDLELAARVIDMDDEIDLLEREILQKTVRTVMRESPVATDLRLLVSTLGVVGEIEKVGDDAVKLSRRATKLYNVFPAEMKLALMELGEHARRSFSHSLKLYTDFDEALAKEVVDADEEIDTKYSTARNRVFELIRANPEQTEHLVRTIEAFHALEHVADHAVEIARRIGMFYTSGVSSHSGAN